jgi:hypothetical protein
MPRERHRLTFILLACALAVRMLVPAGWMPAAGGGPLAIEPCPAADASPIIAMAGHHHDARHHSHKAQHDGDCAFAPLSSGFAASDQPAALLTKMPVAAARPHIPAELFFATGPPALPPPARGPPAIA